MYFCRIDSDYTEIVGETTDSVVLQQNAAYCSQVQTQQNIYSTKDDEYVYRKPRGMHNIGYLSSTCVVLHVL